MGELSLDLKPTPIPPPPPSPLTTTTANFSSPSINLFLKEVSMISNVSEKLSKVDGYIKCLEEEMKKIDAFKRELPLCMLLLNDAIGALKCETMQWKLEKSVNGNENDLLRDKKSWMSSVQLWTTSNEKQKPTPPEVVKEKEKSLSSTDNIFARNGGGAFLPFKGFPGFLTRKDDQEKEILVEPPSLSLLTPLVGMKKPRAEATTSCLVNSKSCVNRVITSSSIENSPSLQSSLQSQASRKQRRCWSPDLHRRFLNALQQLGGSQVATPKQIRELMKVEGLTNDEVKSHLQKYRLHTRRYPANANVPASENQKLVLFGELWVPQDECGTSKDSTSQSESPQGPLQMTGTSGGTSTTGGDSMDDEEDGKSESYNWKGQF